MQDFDEQKGTRYRMARYGEKSYLVIGERWLMFFPPNEAAIGNQEIYSAINAVCRLSSKFLALGGDWQTVVKQLGDANITQGRTLIADMVALIRSDRGLNDERQPS